MDDTTRKNIDDMWDESIARMTARIRAQGEECSRRIKCNIDQQYAYLRERQQTYAGPMDTTDVGNVIEQYKHYQVPVGYAPYIRKRKPPHENATPNTPEIPPKLLIVKLEAFFLIPIELEILDAKVSIPLLFGLFTSGRQPSSNSRIGT